MSAFAKLRTWLGVSILGLCAAVIAIFFGAIALKSGEEMIINLNELSPETSGWSEYCMGYHSLMVPPGLSAYPNPANNIDWNYPQVLRAYQGSAWDAIVGDENFAETVHETKVNGWTFVVARERVSRLAVSARTLIFYGAQKVGDDVILFKRNVSISKIGEPSDAQHVTFYRTLSVLQDTPENRAKGYCFDGFVFVGSQPNLKAEAVVSFNADARHGINVSLTYRMKQPRAASRPLAPQASADDLANILSIEEAGLKKNDQDGIFSKFSGVGDEAERHSLRAILYVHYGRLDAPSFSVNTIDDVGPMNLYDGQKEFLTFLASIRANLR